jgi:uncharacterized membrane protein HdeD (DUF308 family)
MATDLRKCKRESVRAVAESAGMAVWLPCGLTVEDGIVATTHKAVFFVGVYCTLDGILQIIIARADRGLHIKSRVVKKQLTDFSGKQLLWIW